MNNVVYTDFSTICDDVDTHDNAEPYFFRADLVLYEDGIAGKFFVFRHLAKEGMVSHSLVFQEIRDGLNYA